VTRMRGAAASIAVQCQSAMAPQPTIASRISAGIAGP
jgi:hypothetical protein